MLQLKSNQMLLFIQQLSDSCIFLTNDIWVSKIFNCSKCCIFWAKLFNRFKFSWEAFAPHAILHPAFSCSAILVPSLWWWSDYEYRCNYPGINPGGHLNHIIFAHIVLLLPEPQQLILVVVLNFWFSFKLHFLAVILDLCPKNVTLPYLSSLHWSRIFTHMLTSVSSTSTNSCRVSIVRHCMFFFI